MEWVEFLGCVIRESVNSALNAPCLSCGIDEVIFQGLSAVC